MTGIFIAIGILVLAWTVVMIWGSVRASRGRSRVMLLVGGSISLFSRLIGFFGGLGDETTAGGVILSLVFLLMALAIVVLLSMKPAADYFAGHRARRGR